MKSIMRNIRTSSLRRQASAIAGLAFAFALFAPSAFGQTVTLVDSYVCFQGTSTYPGKLDDGLNSTCYEYTVDCNGLATRKVVVKVSVPANEVGSVFFTTGSYGTGFYGDSDPE